MNHPLAVGMRVPVWDGLEIRDAEILSLTEIYWGFGNGLLGDVRFDDGTDLPVIWSSGSTLESVVEDLDRLHPLDRRTEGPHGTSL